MAYPNLKRIYYHDPTNYEQIYKERFNAPTTIQFPLFIRTDYGNSHQLFITMLPQFIQVIEEISDKINKQIWFNKDNFPQAFLNDYIENLIFNEIIATNENATEDLLDGRIFRKESVSVYKRTDKKYQQNTRHDKKIRKKN